MPSASRRGQNCYRHCALAISGQQQTISVQDQRNIVTGVVPTFTPGAGGGGFGGAGGAGGGTVAPMMQPMQMGPQLDVLPYVNSDGFTIEMSLAPQITEFLGYEESTFEAAGLPRRQRGALGRADAPYSYALAECELCGLGSNLVLALGGLFPRMSKPPETGALPRGCAVYRAVFPWQRSQQQRRTW